MSHTDPSFDSMISYPNYKFVFPIQALGMYGRKYGDKAINGTA